MNEQQGQSLAALRDLREQLQSWREHWAEQPDWPTGICIGHSLRSEGSKGKGNYKETLLSDLLETTVQTAVALGIDPASLVRLQIIELPLTDVTGAIDDALKVLDQVELAAKCKEVEVRANHTALQWPAKEQLNAIADAANDLAGFIRQYEYLCVDGERVERKFASNPQREILLRIERLDYLLHGRTIGDLERDRSEWIKQGWLWSLASYVVGSPGSCEKPILGDGATGWEYSVLAPYREIFAKFAAIKYFYGQTPVYSIDTWTRCDRKALIDDITIGKSDEFNPAMFSPWLDSPHWRTVKYGTIDNGTRRNGVKPTRLPPEIGTDERLAELKAKGVPVEWLDSMAESAATLRSEINHDDVDDKYENSIHGDENAGAELFANPIDLEAAMRRVVSYVLDNGTTTYSQLEKAMGKPMRLYRRAAGEAIKRNLINWYSKTAEYRPTTRAEPFCLGKSNESPRSVETENETSGAKDSTPQRSKRRGRPADTDPKADARIAQAWNTGRYKTYNDLERELNLKRGEVKRAIDRNRKRELGRKNGDSE